LIEKLRAADFGAPVSWDHLLHLMATIRFGWMSEWIRRGDTDALEMECVYIDILVDQQEYIRSRWGFN
jgi:homoserine kinase type II